MEQIVIRKHNVIGFYVEPLRDNHRPVERMMMCIKCCSVSACMRYRSWFYLFFLFDTLSLLFMENG